MELLGPRLESEIQRTREREVTQERHTSLDRELARCATGSHVATTRRPARPWRRSKLLKYLRPAPRRPRDQSSGFLLVAPR